MWVASLACALLGLGGLATPAQAQVRVEVVQEGPLDDAVQPERSVVLLQEPPARRWDDPPPYAPSEPADEPEEPVSPMWSGLSLWVDWFDLTRLEDLDFDDPEVVALRGLRLPPSTVSDRGPAWGGSFATTARPTRYLRLPEMRISVGGASMDGPWTAPQGAPPGIEVRATSAVVFRLEMTGGLQVPIGPVTPFALARVGHTTWLVEAEVRDSRLGTLGEETLDDGEWELGAEVGASIRIEDGIELVAAYHRSFTGARGSGVRLGLDFAMGER